MKLISSKETYEISIAEVAQLIANSVERPSSKVELVPMYGWPNGDSPRPITGFEVILSKD